MSGTVAPPSTYPGKTLGIVGLIVSFFFSLIGLIISIIAFNQSKNAGFKNTPAKVGIILGIVFLVLGIIAAVAIPGLIAGACSSGAAECSVSTY